MSWLTGSGSSPNKRCLLLCRQLYFVLSGVCLLIGVTTTHGLGGQLRHAMPTEAGNELTLSWRFFQPFQCAPSLKPHSSKMRTSSQTCCF